MSRPRILCAALIVWLFALACASARPAGGPALTPEGEEGFGTYRIGVTDLLRITVWRNEELSVDVPVRPDGMISVPLIDDVHAEGLTPEELKAIISKELEEYVTAPTVTVVVLNMNSQMVSVLGAVRNPGQFQVMRNMRVMEAIAAAGGFSDFASKGDIRVIRRSDDGSEVEFRFDYDGYVKGRGPETNILLKSGDAIVVPD